MLATEALDEVRREVWSDARRQGNLQLARDLKGARFAVWKNPQNLTDRQAAKLATIQQTNARLYRAYLLKEQLRQIYQLPATAATDLLDGWLTWARRCRLLSFVKLARTITEQRDGILAAIKHGLSNECTSYCTSWCGCGGDVLGAEAGAVAVVIGGGDGFGRRASPAVEGAALAGVVEVGASTVDPAAGDVPSALPDLDRLGADAELFGDLIECQHAGGSESLVVAGDAAVAAQLGERGDGERVAPAAGQPALVEDRDGLVVGVVVEQLVDQRDRCGRGGVRFPGAQGSWDGEGVLVPT